MSYNRPECRVNPYRHFTGCFTALTDADVNYYFKTRSALRFEYADIAADATDSTDKFALVVSYKGPNDADFTVICTTDANGTADAVASDSTADSTSPLNHIIPADSTIRIKVDESGTGTAVTGATFDVAFSYAR